MILDKFIILMTKLAKLGYPYMTTWAMLCGETGGDILINKKGVPCPNQQGFPLKLRPLDHDLTNWHMSIVETQKST